MKLQWQICVNEIGEARQENTYDSESDEQPGHRRRSPMDLVSKPSPAEPVTEMVRR